jgi:hypothetical protein
LIADGEVTHKTEMRHHQERIMDRAKQLQIRLIEMEREIDLMIEQYKVL